jgi:long-chain acyl-CoA synthetase
MTMTTANQAAGIDRFTRIGQIPAYWAEWSPDAPALIENGQTLSYADLQRAIQHAKAALSGLGVGRGHRVMIVAENCAAVVYFLFAASELDAAFILVNARLSAEEIDAIAEHAQPQAEIYLDAGFKDATLHALRRQAMPVNCGAAGNARIVVAPSSIPPEEGHEDVAAMIYTSGTTGKPKGVMLTHAGLLFVATTMASFRQLTPADRSYGVLPMSHTMGLTSVLLSTLVAGGSVVLRPRFEVEALLHAIEEEGITLFQGVQAMYSSLLSFLRHDDSLLGPSRLRYIYAGGSPLDPTLKSEVEAMFDLPLHNGYGMTESSPTICHSRFGEYRSDASVGPPLPGLTVRVVGEDGRDVPDGASGELWVRGPNVMKGYFRDEAATRATVQDGWLRTGDLAQQDEDGSIFLVGRIKDIIIRSGFNVYPAEVEAAVNAHPAVEQSSVVGRDVDRNEEVIAFVQLKPGETLSAAQLQAFLKDKISAYKKPSHIVFLHALPTMANGKVRRTSLKAMAAEMDSDSQPATPALST